VSRRYQLTTRLSGRASRAAHRGRSPHGERCSMREGSNGPAASKTPGNRRCRGEANRPPAGVGRRPRRRSIAATRGGHGIVVGAIENGAGAGRPGQANRQGSGHSNGHQTSGYRGASRVDNLSFSEHLRASNPPVSGRGARSMAMRGSPAAPLTGTFGPAPWSPMWAVLNYDSSQMTFQWRLRTCLQIPGTSQKSLRRS
jgi:hypothetical protein